jgi:TRAP-type C4-dicarboxylate transport system substrate-binding protein
MKIIRIVFFLTALTSLPATGFAQSVSWDVSLWGERRAFTEHVEKLAELVAKKTNGEFVLNLSYGGLSKPRENLDGIAAGAFEMAQFCAGYHKEKNPSITVMELPFLGVNTLVQERNISQWLYRHPSVRKDFGRWNAIALMPSPLPQYNLVGAGEAPVSLLQLAGLNVRATGGIGRAMEALGARPSPMTATEVRQALESGQINAVAFAPHAHMSFGTLSNASWWTTNLNPGTVHCPVVANIDAVASLSESHRDALYGSINEALDYYIAHYEYNMRESWGPVLDRLGIEQVTFNDIELNKFREQVERPAAMEWILEHEQNGLPAREIYTLVKVALTGKNPEQALLTGGQPQQTQWIVSEAEQERAKRQEILAAYSFDKKDASQATVDPAVPETLTVEAPVVVPELTMPAEAITDPGVINGGVAALFVNDRLAAAQPDAPANAAATVTQPVVKTASVENGGYFGLPRNGTANRFSANPLEMMVEWELEESATVGSTIASLSDYIGYQLLTDDQTAIKVYGRKLPRIQQAISGISVGDAFQVLSGQGLATIFDHTYRTVKHVPMKRPAMQGVAPCPADLDLGVRTGDGVLLLPDGGQCSY